MNQDTQQDNKEDQKPLVRMLGKNLLQQEQEAAEGKKENATVRAAVSARLRELMQAENFSVLTGAGSSVEVLGSVTFGNNALQKDGWARKPFARETTHLDELIKIYEEGRGSQGLDPEYGVEEFLHFLYQLEYVHPYGLKINRASGDEIKVAELRSKILGQLKSECGCDLTRATEFRNYRNFLKRIISRPTNLRRTNLFTTNYDLIFERVMDEMGLLYVDGFVGGTRHFFQPQAFNYDYYYPATTTEGRVSRLERVLHFYKLHGSLNWAESNDSSPGNVYGVEKKEPVSDHENLLVYPTPMKEHETIGFPYCELLRRFAGIIQQPQSVLITYGYGFGDAHINRAIYEALNIPSFQLVIVSYDWTPSLRRIWDHARDLPCVGFVVGKEYAGWQTFANELIPDLPTIELEERYETRQVAAKTLRDLSRQSAQQSGTNNGK